MQKNQSHKTGALDLRQTAAAERQILSPFNLMAIYRRQDRGESQSNRSNFAQADLFIPRHPKSVQSDFMKTKSLGDSQQPPTRFVTFSRDGKTRRKSKVDKMAESLRKTPRKWNLLQTGKSKSNDKIEIHVSDFVRNQQENEVPPKGSFA
ncbi:hypothetical protein RUM43_001722 [Polyplax serrata]|uniref:Uncharacterized protein n=1 Tax=Polyplax serrata TaxID=468196 RepID=A0AAN8XR84_POLSC